MTTAEIRDIVCKHMGVEPACLTIVRSRKDKIILARRVTVALARVWATDATFQDIAGSVFGRRSAHSSAQHALKFNEDPRVVQRVKEVIASPAWEEKRHPKTSMGYGKSSFKRLQGGPAGANGHQKQTEDLASL